MISLYRVRRALLRLRTSIFLDSRAPELDPSLRQFIADSCSYHLATGLRLVRRKRRRDPATFNRAFALAMSRVNANMENVSEFSRWLRGPCVREGSPYHFAHFVALLIHLDSLISISALTGQACNPMESVMGDYLAQLAVVSKYLSNGGPLGLSDFEDVLCRDPTGHYQWMTADSKEAYRSAIEAIMLITGKKAKEVATVSLELALENADGSTGDQRASHIGYYLLGDGKDLLLTRLRCHNPLESEQTFDSLLRRNIFIYVGLQLLLATTLAASIALAIPGHLSLWELVLLWLMTTDAVVLSCEAFIGAFVGHRPSLRMNLSSGIPDMHQLAIAVPMLLVSKAQISTALDAARWNVIVANDSNVRIYFLADLPDSPNSSASADEMALLDHIKKECARVNNQLGSRYAFPLHVIFRDREFSPMQKAWIGWERKRGKLEQFNNLIIHGSSIHLVTDEPTLASLVGTTHVLCLDEDTRATKGSIHELMGFALHPLNRPILNKGQVVSGHALVVPTCMTRTQAMLRWRMQSLVGGMRMREDEVPQERRSFSYDFFGLSHYAGKGVYDVAAYSIGCNGKFPSEAILSHDTIEGAYLRPGYSSTAVLVEGFPTSLHKLYVRQHRWARGDLQNLAHAIKCRFAGSGLPGIGEFVIANQNRVWLTNAIFPIAFLALALNPETRLILLTCVVVCMLPGLQKSIVQSHSSGVGIRCGFREFAGAFINGFSAQIVRLSISPGSTFIYGDALLTTLSRLVRGRDLMDWQAASLECNSSKDGRRIIVYMYLGPLIFSLLAALGFFIFGSWTCVLLSVIWIAGTLAPALTSGFFRTTP